MCLLIWFIQCQSEYVFFLCLCVQLRGFLTDVVIDQLPNLLDLKHFLSQLALTDPVAPKKDLILEQVLQKTLICTLGISKILQAFYFIMYPILFFFIKFFILLLLFSKDALFTVQSFRWLKCCCLDIFIKRKEKYYIL